MKTRSKSGHRLFQLQVQHYGNSYYIERVTSLEAALARRPRSLQMDIIGSGEIPADAALLLRSVLLARSPMTSLITNARSSLQGASVLMWLLGDTRMIREDARLFFRRATEAEAGDDDDDESWKNAESKYADSFTESDTDPEEADYRRVLELINEFLPVKELAGRIIELPVLRQFGLVENEKADNYLATAFARASVPAREPQGNSNASNQQPNEKPARQQQSGE